MKTEQMASDAEAKVRRWVLAQFREEEPASHLATCPNAAVVSVAGDDHFTRCFTCGWSGLLLKARVECPHGWEEWEYEGDEVRSLAQILKEIDDQDLLAEFEAEEGLTDA